MIQNFCTEVTLRFIEFARSLTWAMEAPDAAAADGDIARDSRNSLVGDRGTTKVQETLRWNKIVNLKSLFYDNQQ